MDKAGDADFGVMIRLNTILFGLGAVLCAAVVGNGWFANNPLDFDIIGGLTPMIIVEVVCVGLLILGFFHSTLILKPGIRRKSNERQLMAVKINAARHEDFCDRTTGLANKSFFLKVTRDFMESVTAKDRGVGILAIHVDGPKDVHIETLKTVSNCVLENSRDYDVVARVGFDTLAVAVANVDMADLEKIAMRITNALEFSGNVPLLVDLMIGSAVGCDNQQTADELLRNAEANVLVRRDLSIPGLAA